MLQQRYIAWTPGQWFKLIRERNALSIINTYFGIPPTISVIGLGESKTVLYEPYPDTSTSTFALMWKCGDPEAEVPFQLLTDSDGASGGTVFRTSFAGAMDADIIAGLYEDVLTQTLGQIFALDTDATVESISVRHRVSADNRYAIFQASIELGSDAQIRTLLDSLTVTDATAVGVGDDAYGYQTLDALPVIGEPGQSDGTSGALERIADALEDLSTQSVDVSINHGAQMYSVYGRTITDDVP